MRKDSQRGIIGTIASLIIALALLQIVFKVDVIGFFSSDTVTTIISYSKRFILIVWNKFLVTPAEFIWDLLVKSFDIFKNWVDANE